MPDVKAITVTHKELVESLIKHLGYHEGIWQLSVEMGLSAVNIQATNAQTGESRLSPAAFIPINKIGLIRVDAENDLAVDASKVNPV